MAFIYTLSEPDGGPVRYVGKSVDPVHRLCNHIRGAKIAKRVNHTQAWIRSLLSKGQKPVVEVIEQVDPNYWPFWEVYWISQFKSWGFDLTNSTPGGDCGPDFTGRILTTEHKTKISAGIKAAHKANPGHNLVSGHPKQEIVLDKDVLLDLYVNQKKGQQEIARILGCSDTVVCRNMKRHGIGNKYLKISKEHLHELFVVQGLTAHQMADMFSTSANTIWSKLKQNDIKR